ncbi:MAG: TlyA family RNA methyltransferase [Clostridiales bacterium]|nr:TlyA family RNA methyltransferase [Clostridiales bacterium]
MFLSEHGYAKSRSAAAALISGGVTVNGVKITKPAQNVPECESYTVEIANPQKYVSRGGLKLEAALDAFGVSVTGLECADIGASTGGFTDCLIRRGAKKVFAVDVGHGQLDESLLRDERVVNMEGVNARTLNEGDIGGKVPLAVSDISFISQTLIYHAVCDILSDGGAFISLIKPQFEAGVKNIGKGGIVKDRSVHADVINRLFAAAQSENLSPKALIPSPIKGGDGNTEYLALFEKGGVPCVINIKEAVASAFQSKGEQAL